MNFPPFPSSSDGQSTDLDTMFTYSFASAPFFVDKDYDDDDGSFDSPPPWSWHEDRQFEIALVMYPDETPDRWERIAEQLPKKSVDQVFQHYQDLVQDLTEIDAGRCDWLLGGGEEEVVTCLGSGKDGRETASERRRGTPWTEEEHRRFLEGLEKYGKGDWRSISRNAVISRTPTQVASHAQKYFLRLNSVKNKKRPSIHDVRPGSSWAESGDPSEVSCGVVQPAFPGMDVEAQAQELVSGQERKPHAAG